MGNPIAFFFGADTTLAAKLLEILYIMMGIVTAFVGVKTLMEKEHKAKIGTAVFWLALAVVLITGRWLPTWLSGLLVVVMAAPAILRQVQRGAVSMTTKQQKTEAAARIGNKIFLPTLMMGLFAIIFALFLKPISPLVGVGVGVIVAMFMVMAFAPKTTKLSTFFSDAKSMLEIVGPLSMLPMLLAALGAIFTTAGVGPVVSDLVKVIIPEGNIVVGIIVYAVGMALFTAIMGNAFAAITVMTVGIGAPFVLAYGLDPNVVGILALTCGYCGTLCTPMAANFNIVPVAVLEMKNRYGVIKNQFIVAMIMLLFQIVYMVIAAQ